MTAEIAADEIDHLLQTIERVRVTLRVAIPAATPRLPELARGEIFLQLGRLRDVTAITTPLNRIKSCAVFLKSEQLAKARVPFAFDLVRDSVNGSEISHELRANRECARIFCIRGRE